MGAPLTQPIEICDDARWSEAPLVLWVTFFRSHPSLVVKVKKSKISEGDSSMQARMQHPAMITPGAMEALQALAKAAEQGGVPKKTLDLVHLRVSQINGCSVCVDMGYRFKKPEETYERLFTVAAWADAPYFTDAERAALALSEAVTRLSDRSDPVPDEIWDEAARHYDERGLASILLLIAMTNVWNRINVATRQVAGVGEIRASQELAGKTGCCRLIAGAATTTERGGRTLARFRP